MNKQQRRTTMKTKAIIVTASVLLLAGCATGGPKRGHVVMKTGEGIAHVALGRGEVQVGDHIELYQNRCAGGGKGTDRTCKKISKGHGEITELFDADYSLAKFPEGTQFTEGDTVEKHSH
jgi:hypothetical protein